MPSTTIVFIEKSFSHLSNVVVVNSGKTKCVLKRFPNAVIVKIVKLALAVLAVVEYRFLSSLVTVRVRVTYRVTLRVRVRVRVRVARCYDDNEVNQVKEVIRVRVTRFNDDNEVNLVKGVKEVICVRVTLFFDVYDVYDDANDVNEVNEVKEFNSTLRFFNPNSSNYLTLGQKFICNNS